MRIALPVVLSLLVFSCARHADESGRQVFAYNEMNGVTSLDPAMATSLENIWPVNQLFNGLLEMDDSLNVRPAIARSFSVSANGLAYTFLLRTDVSFHDDACFESGKGRTVTANDFVYSFRRLYDSRVSAATTLLDKIDRGEHNGFRGFEAVNDSVLRIYLSVPFSAFPSILTMKFFSVLPREAIEKYGADFRRHPVGTGPFAFKMWEEGNKLVLLRNPRYFERDALGRALPYLDAVAVSFIRDRETAFMELLAGKFDMLSGADVFNINEVLDRNGTLREVYARKFNLQKATFLKTDYIGVLIDPDLPIVQRSPLRDVRVRQAINFGFDRDRMVKYLRNNVGVAAHAGFIPKGMKSYDTSKVRGYRYNPDKARQLLAEAGYPGGRGLPELTIHISDNYREQAEFIQSQLAQINVRVQVSIEKAAALRQSVNNGEMLLFKKSWVADYPDEENFLSLFYSKNFTPHGMNYFHYSDPAFDKDFELAQTTSDETTRLALYQRMDGRVIAAACIIPLYYDEVVRLTGKNVRGLRTNPMNLLNLKRVSKRPVDADVTR